MREMLYGDDDYYVSGGAGQTFHGLKWAVDYVTSKASRVLGLEETLKNAHKTEQNAYFSTINYKYLFV